ncbi:MAG TPA: hypothetical protein DCR45_10175 [Gammaproteobacteria bacterium]|nr:MAG: CHASE2 domain-containing protein [Gammaproteobacteria bacterium TMED163]HAR91327.1 hypothetical protein [Gammaproteobacteria bacterium]HAU24527.1 hypothetical protein [Gammaproteobacteria bacterium]|tara:strand:+ start:347 stop:631 length:285 start_codon:yes stop_codon:yes gene_type:complete
MSIKTRLKPFSRVLSEGKRLPIYLGGLATMLVLLLQLSAPPLLNDFLTRLEYLVYDQRLRVMPKAENPEENKIVIVDLDERSLQAEGQYPWNRI